VNDRARHETNSEDFEEMAPADLQTRSSGVRRAEPASAHLPVVLGAAPQLSIGMPASEALLEPTYAYLSAYCFAVFGPGVAQRLNVAVYELFANALRHGSGQGDVRVELRRFGSGVMLLVSNHATPAQVERLRRHVERVQSSPKDAFNREMSRFETATEPAPMLGIVRVAHEAGLALHLRVEDGWIEVSTLCG
jgi:signal transduction histidine kinase